MAEEARSSVERANARVKASVYVALLLLTVVVVAGVVAVVSLVADVHSLVEAQKQEDFRREREEKASTALVKRQLAERDRVIDHAIQRIASELEIDIDTHDLNSKAQHDAIAAHRHTTPDRATIGPSVTGGANPAGPAMATTTTTSTASTTSAPVADPTVLTSPVCETRGNSGRCKESKP